MQLHLIVVSIVLKTCVKAKIINSSRLLESRISMSVEALLLAVLETFRST